MDIMRWGYIGDMQVNDTQRIKVKWVACQPGAQPPPFSHAFGSSRQMYSLTQATESGVGERFHRYVKGAGFDVSPLPGDHVCGDKEYWQNGWPVGTAPLEIGVAGIPVCCGAKPTKTGGLVIGGGVNVASVDIHVSGGLVFGGAHEGTVGHGGLVIGGKAAASVGAPAPVSGGILLSGKSSLSTADSGKGGLLVGGSLAPLVAILARGGLLFGGSVSAVIVMPGDMLANFVNTANSLTNPSGATLSVNTWNYIAASSACNAKLPTPTAGNVIGVYIVNSSTALFTLNPNSSEKIQPGNNTSRLMWAGESAVLISNGTDWIKVAGVSRPMSCRIHSASSSTQAMTVSSVSQFAAFDTTDYDPSGMMADLANNRVKIVRPGFYECAAFAGFSDATATFTNNIQQIWAQLTAVTASRGIAFDQRCALASGYVTMSIAGAWNFSAADTVILRGFFYDGGAGSTVTWTDNQCAIEVIEDCEW